MAYHPPGHPFHRLSWFPEKALSELMNEATLGKVKEIWLQTQNIFWDQIEVLEKFEIADAETGQKLSDESDPNAFGVPNYIGLPAHLVKLNDLRRLREAGRQYINASTPQKGS